MFNGIIESQGKILKIDPHGSNKIFSIQNTGKFRLKNGDSVSVDGACMTVIAKSALFFKVEAMPETLKRTILGKAVRGIKVNLETPLRMNQKINGHFVTGHVDCLGKVEKIKKEGFSDVLTISLPQEQCRYLALKGSVSVNGVSLTISKLANKKFEISLIPYTLQNTNLGTLQKGDYVNIEVDLISRYLESLLNNKEEQAKYHFLQERGFI